MNFSSLFSFGESSDWDIKEIRKRLIVSQDQLIKLNSIPGWTKKQDNQDILRLDKDLSIGSSQSESSVNATQNNISIENNSKLFNEQIENRKSILKTYKVYENKLTRSLSLFTIDKSCENLNSKTLKRTLSLPNIYQSSNSSNVNAFKYIRCENSAKKHFSLDFSNKTVLQRQLELPTQCKISHSVSQKNKELFLSRENSGIMETISQLPVNIPATVEKPSIKENNGMLPTEKIHQPIKDVIESVSVDAVNLCPETSKEHNSADNVDLHSETVKMNNGVLPAESVATHSNNMFDQVKRATESQNNDKSDLNSEMTKEGNDVLPAVNVTQSMNVSNEPAKTVNDILIVDNSVSSLKNLAESCVHVVDESHDPDISIVKEIPAYKISVLASEKATSSLNVQEEEKCLSSPLSYANETNSLMVKETISENCSTSMANADDVPLNLEIASLSGSKSPAISEPAKEVAIPDKEVGTEIGICNSDAIINDSVSDIKMESVENDQKECDPAKYIKAKSIENDQKECEPDKSSANNETSSAKKRKLESRNKRSKKLKSEEKQGTLKIRSIKKVGEVCYSAEEIKTMLDIMKQFS